MRNKLRTSWWTPVTIPFTYIAEHLSESDYEKYGNKFLNVEIEINFDVHPKDPSVGIFHETVEYTGDWSVPRAGNYPDAVKEAIDKYLDSIDVVETFGEKLDDQMDCYYERMMYPDL